MSSLAFVLVRPGQPSTPAAKHEERVEIYSHAQKVTQRRKRERRILEQRSKPENQVLGSRQPRRGKVSKNHSYDDQTERRSWSLQKYQFDLPTPSPEPDVDRALTINSTWTEDQRNGISMFTRLTTGDINAVSTNMNFWNIVAPLYSQTWDCIRDIVSANACANEAVQRRDDNLFLKAEHLHLRAISGLRRDLLKLPLSAQVASCLLFEAYSVLRCEFGIVGKQIDTAKMLTKNIPVNTYRTDEFLPTVCDTLAKMSLVPAWSLWNPSHFLKFEGLRLFESQLHLQLEPVNTNQGVVKGLVDAVQRLSRQCSGRIRRNLSERAFIDPTSSFARDVIDEFHAWKVQFDWYVAENGLATDKEALQQAELGWSFTYITFSTGVLDYGEMVFDNQLYQSHFARTNELCAEIFSRSFDSYNQPSIKAFLQIVVPTLWLLVMMCRDPKIRNRAITTLYSREFQESDFNSYITAKLAERVVEIEAHGRVIQAASDLSEDERIRVEGVKYDEKTKEVVLSYSLANHPIGMPFYVNRMPWKVEGDVIKFNNAISALSQTCTLYRKVKPAQAPAGYIKPMIYKDEYVPVLLA